MASLLTPELLNPEPLGPKGHPHTASHEEAAKCSEMDTHRVQQTWTSPGCPITQPGALAKAPQCLPVQNGADKACLQQGTPTGDRGQHFSELPADMDSTPRTDLT